MCGGNCKEWLEPAAAFIFQNATDFRAVVHPNAGHGINFNYNATGAYTVMLDYLKTHDL